MVYLICFFWCGRQESNLHAVALDSKSSVSASFTTSAFSFLNNGDPQAILTPDPLIKSQMLYLLS